MPGRFTRHGPKQGKLPLGGMPERPSTRWGDSSTGAGGGKCKQYDGCGRRSDRKDSLQLPGYNKHREILGVSQHLEWRALRRKQEWETVCLLVRKLTSFANTL